MSTHLALQAGENDLTLRDCHSEFAPGFGASEESALRSMRPNSRFLASLGMTNTNVVPPDLSAACSTASIPEPGLDIWAAWEEALALPAKARGEVAEMILVPMLMTMGIIVAKPFGDSSPWDLVVQAGNRLSRLQVKSAWVKGKQGYQINVSSYRYKTERRRRYRPEEIDFLVAYVAPEEAWFVIPVSMLRGTGLYIKPDPDSPCARYRDRWDLLYGTE